MPSPWHDAVTQLIRDHPALGPRILRECAGGDDLPLGLAVTVGSPHLNDRISVDFFADALVLAVGPTHDPAYGLFVEAQQAIEEYKLEQWARYLAAFWLQTRRPARLLVFCRDQRVADWYQARQPILTCLIGYRPSATIVGPGLIPAVTSADQMATDMAMASLSFASHGTDPAVAGAFLTALGMLPDEDWPTYYEFAHCMSSRALRDILEGFVGSSAIVSSPIAKRNYRLGKADGVAEGKAEGVAEGRAAGEAEAILLILETRGLPITTAERARIKDCTDLGQLKEWVALAITVKCISELFD
jgi:hypothetical protein